MTAAHRARHGVEDAELSLDHARSSGRSTCSATGPSAMVAGLLARAGIEFVGEHYADWADGRASPRHQRPARCPSTRSCRCRWCAAPRSPGVPTGRGSASSRSTRTGASRACPASTRPATRPTSRSSRAASPPSRPTPSPQTIAARARRAGSRPSRSGRCCAACCSPAASRASCAPTRGGDDAARVLAHALWWPPAKIAGRYLAPYLAARDRDRRARRAGGLNRRPASRTSRSPSPSRACSRDAGRQPVVSTQHVAWAARIVGGGWRPRLGAHLPRTATEGTACPISAPNPPSEELPEFLDDLDDDTRAEPAAVPKTGPLRFARMTGSSIAGRDAAAVGHRLPQRRLLPPRGRGARASTTCAWPSRS